jgi:hypothetical protein
VSDCDWPPGTLARFKVSGGRRSTRDAWACWAQPASPLSVTCAAKAAENVTARAAADRLPTLTAILFIPFTSPFLSRWVAECLTRP